MLKPMKKIATTALSEALRQSAGAFQNDQSLLHATAVLLRSGEAWAAYETFISTPHPSVDKAGHKMKVEQQAKKLFDTFRTEFEKAKIHLRDRYNEVEKLISTELGVQLAKDNLLSAVEIRQGIKAMEKNDRLARIKNAIDRNDLTITGAIFSAPAFLSGLTDGMASQLYKQAAIKNCGELVQLKNVILQTNELLDSQFSRIKSGVQDVTGRSVSRLAAKSDQAVENLQKAIA